MIKRILGALVAFALALTASLAVAVAPASAETPPCTPPLGSPNSGFCLYDSPPPQPGYEGMIDFWSPTIERNTCTAVLNPVGKAASSMVNNSHYKWRVFRTLTCGGSSLTMNPHTYWIFPSDWNNNIVAITRTSTVDSH